MYPVVTFIRYMAESYDFDNPHRDNSKIFDMLKYDEDI